MKDKIFLLIPIAVLHSTTCLAEEWVPLVPDGMFDGVRADLLLAVGGILSLVLIVVGLGVLIKAFLN